jgi:ribose/xylose/arabinose/galactoside ABC-type transport system permease subunit
LTPKGKGQSVPIESNPVKKPSKALRFSGSLGWVWTVVGPFLGLIGIVLLFAYLTRDAGRFMTLDNWRTIAVQSVIVAIAALGMTLVMIAGGIDLSVGSVVALVCVVMALLLRGSQWHLPQILGGATLTLPAINMLFALPIGIAIGGLCGLINGTLITRLRLLPFIVTLGGMKVFRGLAKWLASNSSVYAPQDSMPGWFEPLMKIDPTPRWLMVAPGVWIVLALSVLLALVLRYSLFGRYIYAIGSNESTARLCGIGVSRVKVAVYGLAGLMTGLASVMLFSQFRGTGDSTAADGLELQVIAAVVIGGASLNGGQGTVLGTIIGCLIMSVLNNGCVHAGISNSSQDIIIGAIIVAAVTLDRFRRVGNT